MEVLPQRDACEENGVGVAFGHISVRLDEASSRASSLSSRASSLFFRNVCATSQARLGSNFDEPDRAEPRARLGSIPPLAGDKRGRQSYLTHPVILLFFIRIV
jgi:hypothetical protein